MKTVQDYYAYVLVISRTVQICAIADSLALHPSGQMSCVKVLTCEEAVFH